jgi:cell division protein FtsL
MATYNVKKARLAKKRNRRTISLVFVLTVMFVLSHVVYKVTLSQINLETEKLRMEVNSQSNRNQSLTMKVDELSAPKNVQQVAQNLGLAYNNSNIRIVSE